MGLQVGYHQLCRVKCKIVNNNKKEDFLLSGVPTTEFGKVESVDGKLWGFRGKVMWVSEEAPHIRTTLSLTSAIHPAPGRNITYAIVQLIASRAAVQNKTLTGMCRHRSPTGGDGVMA
jgi:hypothetical protein